MEKQPQNLTSPGQVEILAANARFFEAITERSITSLLLKGFKTGQFDSNLHWIHEGDRVIQLSDVFNLMNAESQEIFKAATVRALVEWRLKSHGAKTLTELASLAAYIGASEVFDQVRMIIENEWLQSLGWDTYKRTVSVLIAALANFKGLQSVNAFFDRLFFDPHFNENFSAQLFLALCRRQPDNYAHYLPRFLEISQRLGDYFRMDIIIHDFVSSVTLSTIVKHFRELPTDSLIRFIDLLCYKEWSPAQLQQLDVGQSPAGIGNSSQQLVLSYKDVNQMNEHIRFPLSEHLSRVTLQSIQNSFLDITYQWFNAQGGPVQSLKETINSFIPPDEYVLRIIN